MKRIVYLFAFGMTFVSCSKDSTDTATKATTTITVQNLAADTIIGLTPGVPPTGGIPFGAGRYRFYSLETNQIIPSSDSASNKWDLGFRGTTIITNSGNSGPAAGGGFLFVGLFNSLTNIPNDSTFRIDNAPTAYAIPSGSNRGWYVYDAINNLVNPIPGRVLVIRTASGKYAKVEILNYYKGGVTPPANASDAIKLSEQRYYTFRYSFQPNGSKSF
jgi:HmuY protein